MAPSLPYHEPGIVDILILSSFLLALNAINSVLDKTVYCGLIGQVLVGIAWGTPGGKWLSSSLEDAVVQLGYLGLIMIVFEGGLSTSINTMRANLLLSVCVALTGIAAPMALSFFLFPMVEASYIQCFAAGAALCSTSLGTTFTVLSTSGLVTTRLGCVLSTAAMMDDVVGLVMVQIISSLGSGNTNIAAATVIRPVLVSVAFATLMPLACRFIVRPGMLRLRNSKSRHSEKNTMKLLQSKQGVFVLQTTMLLALVVGASYAGASVLLAAYLAGVIGAWVDSQNHASEDINESTSSTAPEHVSNEQEQTRSRQAQPPENNQSTPSAFHPGSKQARFSNTNTYEHYYSDALNRVLKPFFFASIGFSIPISKMFSGPVVWRGIIYSVLMLIGKLLCGLWLVRIQLPLQWTSRGGLSSVTSGVRAIMRRLSPSNLIHQSKADTGSVVRHSSSGSQPQLPPTRESQPAPAGSSTKRVQHDRGEKPLSLYPAGIVSFAMVARGEIGFLISSVAESNGIFQDPSTQITSADETTEIFLIITWAIVLCTIIGPLCVGLLVRRIKRLESESAADRVEGAKRDVLGVWGVS